MSDNKSSVEFIEGLAEKLCAKWTNNLIPNKKIDIFLSSIMIALIDSMPNVTEEQSLIDLKIKNEAIEEIEYLSELLYFDCREQPQKGKIK